jgi:hypothetical protein
MNSVKIPDGTRVKMVKVHEGDCYFEEPDVHKIIGEPAVVVSHFPDELQEEGTNGTRGGCTLDYDKTMGQIFGYEATILDDHCMVFADVELEVIQ